jgi:hypothetical protein
MKNLILFAWALLAVLLPGCQKPQMNEVFPDLPVQELNAIDSITVYTAGNGIFRIYQEIIFNRDGYFIVADPATFKIHLFDPQGNKAADFGNQGSGPGEFQHISNYALSDDNVLFVQDPRQDKVVIYDFRNEKILHERAGLFIPQMLFPMSRHSWWIDSHSVLIALHKGIIGSAEYKNAPVYGVYNFAEDELKVYGSYPDGIGDTNSPARYAFTVLADGFVFAGYRSSHKLYKHVLYSDRAPVAVQAAVPDSFRIGDRSYEHNDPPEVSQKIIVENSGTFGLFATENKVIQFHRSVNPEWFSSWDHADRNYFLLVTDHELNPVAQYSLARNVVGIRNNQIVTIEEHDDFIRLFFHPV